MRRITPRVAWALLVTSAVAVLPARAVAQPHERMIGAHALPLVTRAAPTAGGARLTEAYLSQLAGMAGGTFAGGHVELMAMLNLEGLTLDRGELTTGGYGEGYVDRRHPHAYLHEAIATLRTAPGARLAISLSAGRGFATFGSDDPMVRPFAKYPVNHHLAQVLERGMVAAAARAGAWALEASLFNGNEPTRPSDLPTIGRIGDSYAVRATWTPSAAVEVTASVADVRKPEVERGPGNDQWKWHAGARYERGGAYALAEWARTRDSHEGDPGQRYETILAEAARGFARGTVALRVERTDRHEEERLGSPFRTSIPPTDFHVLGITRWTTVTASASLAPWAIAGVRGAPFVELAGIGVADRVRGVFDIDGFYGARRMSMVSAGLRMTAGTWHRRMGRYGVAAITAHGPHHAAPHHGAAHHESQSTP